MLGDARHMDFAARVSANFKRLRKQLGGTQEAFSELSGMVQPQISRLENGGLPSGLVSMVSAVEKAGGDPFDLFAPLDQEIADSTTVRVRQLLSEVEHDDRLQILALLELLVRKQNARANAG